MKLRLIFEISGSFSCFAFIGTTLAKILKYFAQSCDCIIESFRKCVLNLTVYTCIGAFWSKIITYLAPIFVQLLYQIKKK